MPAVKSLLLAAHSDGSKPIKSTFLLSKFSWFNISTADTGVAMKLRAWNSLEGEKDTRNDIQWRYFKFCKFLYQKFRIDSALSKLIHFVTIFTDNRCKVELIFVHTDKRFFLDLQSASVLWYQSSSEILRMIHFLIVTHISHHFHFHDLTKHEADRNGLRKIIFCENTRVNIFFDLEIYSNTKRFRHGARKLEKTAKGLTCRQYQGWWVWEVGIFDHPEECSVTMAQLWGSPFGVE